MSAPWTPASLREHLPAITINVAGRACPGWISGRGEAFALVTARLGNGQYARWEYAWENLAHALNTCPTLTP